MSEAERIVFFNNHIDKLKEDEEAIENKNENIFSVSKKNDLTTKGALFYFYNPTAVAYGKNEFKKIWGDKKLTENWRNGQNNETSNSLKINEKENPKAETTFDLEGYLNAVPNSPAVIDSIYKQLNYSYFQLASIYSSKFLEYELSNKRLQKIDFNRNKEKLVLPAKYLNYKNCIILGLISDAESIKIEIIRSYPRSKYAEILNNPDSYSGSDLDNITQIYADLFKDFQNQQYLGLISDLDKLISIYETHPLVPKMQLLKASAVARIEGFENYKILLEFIVANYPNSIEGKEAKIVLNEVIPLIENTEFEEFSKSENFKIIYSFPKEKNKEIELFKKELILAVNDLKNIELSSSIDVYDNSTTFVVLHGLKSFDGAKGLNIILEKNKNVTNDSSFVISSENYQTLQIHKNLSVYLNNNL